MPQTYSPQNWKKTATKKKKRAIKSYRPLAEKTKSFRSRRLGQPNGFKRLIQKLINFLIWIFVIGAMILVIAFFWYSRELPTSTELLTKNPGASTKIYDHTGEILLNDVNADFRRIKISLNNLPEYVKWSAIVAEDKQFYSHHGINFRGILRAVFKNILRGDPTGEGGSSISQQFVKNALLSPEKTYTRKLKEAILTWQLERRFSKDEILEMYFNEIPYGGTAYGIESASNKYFDKSAVDLSLAEASVLAALPQAPSYYSPYGSRKDKLILRQHWILDSLVEEGYIPEAKAEAAKLQELDFKNVSSSILAPHFVFYVRDLIAEEYGEEMLESGGLSIITTLNMDQQRIAEEVVKERVETNIEKYNARNASLVAMSVDTGEITAMIGSADYFDEDNDGAVNVALRPRQPGSSFKPIVYTTAFSKGYTPETILFDTLTNFKAEPEDYEPHNYDEAYYGPVSIKKALAGSLNVPAVKTMYLVGVENILDKAEDMGYSTFEDRSRFGLSLVLGGGEVKLLEHTAGFATLADEGEYKKPLAILEVKDKDGKTLEKNNPQRNKKKRIFDKDVALQTTSILSDNNERAFVFGEANYLTLGARPVAAKTGTTNDYKDAWTMGYTVDLACGVWVGNTRGETMTGAAAGANTAAPIWNAFMKRVHEETRQDKDADEVGWEIKSFEQPKREDLPNKAMLNGKLADEIVVKIDKNTGKLATDLTPASQIEEKIFREVHNVLHYVNKNNPLGPVPSEPWNLDENYNNWELAVEEWAKANGYETDIELPTDKDDLHVPENKPNISINSPSNNSEFTSLEITVNISSSAKRGVQRVEYYLDNTKINTITTSPFNLENFKLVGFNNGEHVLKAIAFDDVDNSASDEIKIILNLSASDLKSITVLSPNNSDTILAEMFPYPIEISINNFEYYTKADFYIRNSSGLSADEAGSKWIGWREIKNGQEVLTWSDVPVAGEYDLYILITDKYGHTTESQSVKIEIK
ncbi:penicillin-binding protein [Patescibacteria group bacterium]